MNNKTIGILSLIFIVLGVYVYVFEIDRTVEVEELPKVEKLLDFNPEEVTEIVLTRQDERIVFKRESDQWVIQEPIKAKARKAVIDDLLSLFDYGIVREIDTTLSDAPNYGLDPPEIEFEIKFKNALPQTLLIGHDSPGSTCCYGRIKDQSRIVLLGIRYKWDLDQSLDTFIDKYSSQ